MIKTFEDQFSKIQTQIIEKYCNLEPSKSCVISDDNWIRKKGGGGRTFIIEKGKFFDKAAINFSSISGKKLPRPALDNIEKDNANSYQAMGVSVITHPKNPFITTRHMNVRLFLLLNKKKEVIKLIQ